MNNFRFIIRKIKIKYKSFFIKKKKKKRKNPCQVFERLNQTYLTQHINKKNTHT